MNKYINLRKETFDVLGEFVKDSIPFAGTLLRLGEVPSNLSDQIFRAKIDRFLNNLPDIEENEREKFIHELYTNTDLKKKLCEVILLIIDQINDFDKVEMLSKTFVAYIKEEINLDYFRRISAAINSAFSDDLKKFAKGHNNNLALNQALLHTGLTLVINDRKITYSPNQPVKKSGIEVVVSSVGRAFKELMSTQN